MSEPEVIVLHRKRRAVGIVRGDWLYTHNFKLSWPRPKGGWEPCAEDRLPARLRKGILARARANAARGWVP